LYRKIAYTSFVISLQNFKMNKLSSKIIILCFFISTLSTAQSYVFGFKGGLTIGSQIPSSSNSLLFNYHGAAFIENAPSDPTSVLFAQLGYHSRGTANRYRAYYGFDRLGNQVSYDAFTQEFVYNNIALIIGAKKRNVLGSERAYYSLGLRAEYTVKTNLALPDQYSIFTFSSPINDFVNKFNYGVSVAAGYEYPFSDLIKGFVEISVHPDISKQYYRPAFTAYDVYSRQNIDISEQSFRNLTFEISIGVHFLNKVIIVDGEK